MAQLEYDPALKAVVADFDPMIYDALRELKTRISGALVAWQDAAATEVEAQHWWEEHLNLRAEVRAVDRHSEAAIQAELRKPVRGNA